MVFVGALSSLFLWLVPGLLAVVAGFAVRPVSSQEVFFEEHEAERIEVVRQLEEAEPLFSCEFSLHSVGDAIALAPIVDLPDPLPICPSCEGLFPRVFSLPAGGWVSSGLLRAPPFAV